ncbi:MAG TPA: hypothetical protein VEC93_08775, partial [Anaerolineae bacterium]|nr:hypothetical protein [Anaerolineae bacterium]
MITSEFRLKLRLLITALAFLLTLALPAGRVSAQEPWPPFWFDLIPAYESGRLTYKLNLYSRVDWPMPDLTIKIPLPEGTRFLEGKAQAGISITSDGQEVIVFTSAFNGNIENASFTLEVTEPTQTVFTTQARISWKGGHEGEYGGEVVSFDTTRPVLNWQAPVPARLQLGISTTVAGDVITYALYPKATDRLLLWDLRVNVPLPEGISLVGIEAPPSFTASFDGREVSFFTLEL